ncbi:MAG TPA: cysteine methyltransferase [Opitutae bacterium]|nr:cysteine methyltransferase [Opitutae bacterium]|tara:strand:+ start:1063 stop:1377 length:315 start_codon:yes stop_codon:yes gene_type:complete
MKKTLTFDQRCHALLAQIPKGRVSTYRELAHALGSKAYRAVGQAMNRNPNLMKVPCHRVIRSNGEIGGYALGADKKRELLLEEGIQVETNGRIRLSKYLHPYST